MNVSFTSCSFGRYRLNGRCCFEVFLQCERRFDRSSAPGQADIEFTRAGDYLLYVDGKAAGIIEAKKQGATLTGVEVQSAR